ncbi:hypothetical protein [Frigoribacterium sp. PvP054]|uniref:hypothetical protein n=1 Tax=Frigoribacterium sp. PvP054 TaxID=3156438 RepID=UPI003396745D
MKSVVARVFGMLAAALAVIGLVRLLQGQAGFGAAFLFAAFVSVVVSYALVRSVNASRSRPDGRRRPDGPGRPDGRRRPDGQPGRGGDRRR